MNHYDKCDSSMAARTIGGQNIGAVVGVGAPPMSEVVDQMNALSIQIDRLGKVSDALIERIGPVISPRGTAATGQTEAPEVSLCTHAHEIRLMVKRVARYATMLEEAHHSVEL